METVLVTGAAGFIGFHVARRLCADGFAVVGLDNLDPYYDVRLKRDRLAELATCANFRFVELDLADRGAMAGLFGEHRFDYVVHLGGQAGVRYSLLSPHAYGDANLIGFLNVLEGCRAVSCRHLLFASSSSVYGARRRMPLRTAEPADHPLSLYGATKRANELMAHSYAHLFGLPATGLRFFTVYGPWGRPDMAMWLFTAAIMDGKQVRLFNNGKMRRDFTYIDDVTEAVARLVHHQPQPDPSWADSSSDPAASNAPWRIYNVGNSRPVELMDLLTLIEQAVGQPAQREFLSMQAGDVVETCADSTDLERAVGFRPNTSIEEGTRRFVDWFCAYRAGRAGRRQSDPS
jgi:UDP-glucuronate 4-epimerase